VFNWESCVNTANTALCVLILQTLHYVCYYTNCSVCSIIIVYVLQQVLHDVADYEDRRHYLETLKDRLEALVAPKLIAAINGHSSGLYVSVVCPGVFSIYVYTL